MGINSVDDIRRKVGELDLEDTDCTNLTYDHDIDPWLGNRAAAAAVDLGGDEPDFVVVVQVKDEGKARDAITALNTCDTEEDPAGFVVHDGWAVVAQSQKVADGVVDATNDGTLADDATYQKWTNAVGDAGVVNAYASPDAGRVLGQELGGFLGGTFGEDLGTPVPGESSGDSMVEPGAAPSISNSSFHATTADGAGDPFSDALSEFKGGAATLRFTGDGLEFAMAGDGAAPQLSDLTGNTGGQLVQRLPDDTAAAAGITFKPGWLTRRYGAMAGIFGCYTSPDGAYRELSRQTGLDVPDDIETLLGSGVTFSIGETSTSRRPRTATTASGLPVAATVKGDPAAIETVLRQAPRPGPGPPFLGSDSSGRPGGDRTEPGIPPAGAGGWAPGGRRHVPERRARRRRRELGVLREHRLPRAVHLGRPRPATRRPLTTSRPLRAVGFSTWTDSDVIRFSFKVTTN